MGWTEAPVTIKEVITTLSVSCFRKGGGLGKDQDEVRLRQQGRRWRVRSLTIKRSKL